MGFIADEPIENLAQGFATGGRPSAMALPLVGERLCEGYAPPLIASGLDIHRGAAPTSVPATWGVLRDASASVTHHFSYIQRTVSDHVRATGRSTLRAAVHRIAMSRLPVTQIDADGKIIDDCRNRFLHYPYGPMP